MAKSSLTFLLLTCSTLFHQLLTQEDKIIRAKLGQPCNSSVRCDTSVFLTCTNSVCECQKVGSMYYDPIIGSCLTRVKEKCKYPLIKTKDVNGEMRNIETKMEEELDCVQNAFCNRSGFCMCENDYIELGNGTCILKRNLGESCTSDFECRQDQFLICVNGKCGCNDTIATYNILIRQCVGKAGKPCLGSSAGCVYNSECIDSSSSYLGFTKRRMRQSVQLCGCNPGFIEDKSGFCRVGLGGTCSSSKLCAQNFICKNRRCSCPYENTQLGMSRSQTCVSLVGGPCNETLSTVTSTTPIQTQLSNTFTNGSAMNYQRQIFNCVDNAFCALVGNNSIYECQCNDGFTKGLDGTCDLAYGSQCSTDSLNTDDVTESTEVKGWGRNLFCDRKVPLYCVDGFCQCESDLYLYDTKQEKCVGKFGAKCDLRKNVNETCISGAKCVPLTSLNDDYGRCSCLDGFLVTNTRICNKP